MARRGTSILGNQEGVSVQPQAGLGSFKELGCKKAAFVWGMHVPCLALRAQGWGAGLSGCSLLLLSVETRRTQGAKDYNVPPQISSKISD